MDASGRVTGVFIDAFMPDGWRDKIEAVKATIVGYDGVKH